MHLKGMSDHPNIDELNYEVTRLKQLLDDPRPGLFTWRTAFYRQADTVRNLLNEYVAGPATPAGDLARSKS